MNLENKTPKVSIGMPTYNNANHLRKSIDSLLNQSFTDFELIISDNASTDASEEICFEYAKKDKRINYIRQKKNLGATKNFSFVLQKARAPYFMWASSDDIWDPEFIEKNLHVLESCKNIVGSIGEVDFYGKFKWRHHDKNHRYLEKHWHVRPLSGTYEDKVVTYLKFGKASLIYSLFRTSSLRDVEFNKIQLDFDIILHALKYGDIHVIDKILLHRSSEGMSSIGAIHSLRAKGFNGLKLIIIHVPLMSWYIKNFGLKSFMRNIRTIIRLHYIVYGRVVLDLIRWFKIKYTQT